MSLEQASLISQIISAFGVVASLIFVGIQVRQNTKATRAQIRENIIGDWSAVASVLLSKPDVFAAGIAGTQDEYFALSNADKLTFNTQAFLIFKHYENLYLQYEAGFLERELWEAWSKHILMYFHQSGIQHWWKMRGMNYSPQFRRFLETSSPPEMISQAEVFERRPGDASASGT